MPTGEGGSLGEALCDLFAKYTRAGGPRSSYRAHGWHAQLRELTGTRAGRRALDDSDLFVTRRTLTAWLAEQQTPTPANRARIARAYAAMAGGFDPRLRYATYRITGEVEIGDEVRYRGRYGSGPLLIEGSLNFGWAPIAEVWDSSRHPDPDLIEDLFIELVVLANIETSEHITFPGSDYRVET